LVASSVTRRLKAGRDNLIVTDLPEVGWQFGSHQSRYWNIARGLPFTRGELATNKYVCGCRPTRNTFNYCEISLLGWLWGHGRSSFPVLRISGSAVLLPSNTYNMQRSGR
jgi:hypothetical protein